MLLAYAGIASHGAVRLGADSLVQHSLAATPLAVFREGRVAALVAIDKGSGKGVHGHFEELD